jgi:hypothetical protein
VSATVETVTAELRLESPVRAVVQQLILERDVWFNLAQNAALEAELAHREVARLKQELEALKGRG